MSEENQKKQEERFWWEIPLRWAAAIAVIFILIPDQWYRYAYHKTIVKFFPETVESRLEQISERVKKRIHVKELPVKLHLVALKREQRLEIWGEAPSGERTLIKSTQILAASGKAGPKLREGGLQVPEGIYKIESLNPNSLFYLALRINYPSEEDKRIAVSEGRDLNSLGGDIMLHGSGGSVGCISIANRSMEEVFYLAAKTGVNNIQIVIAPYDFREIKIPEDVKPEWLRTRYLEIRNEMKKMINLKR